MIGRVVGAGHAFPLRPCRCPGEGHHRIGLRAPLWGSVPVELPDLGQQRRIGNPRRFQRTLGEPRAANPRAADWAAGPLARRGFRLAERHRPCILVQKIL